MKRLLAALACLLAGSVFAQQAPFAPGAFNTNNLAVTGSAQNITVPGPIDPSSKKQIVVTNIGTQPVFFRCDGATATTSNGMPVLPGSQFVMSLISTVGTCSAIALTTGSTLYMSVGTGQ